jgi:hypothetical protein
MRRPCAPLPRRRWRGFRARKTESGLFEIGIYEFADLLAQPVRPGTIDLGQHHVWLHGDRSLMQQVARALDRPMQAEEALHLLENRAWDAWDALRDASAANASQRRAQAAKVVMDIGAAHLIAEGRFAAKRSERLRRLREHRPALISSRAMDAIEAAAKPDHDGVHSTLDDAATVRALIAEAWLALSPAILGRTTGNADAVTLLATRCEKGAFVKNYREFVRMRRSASHGVLRALAGGWRVARLSPRAALRTYALARALSESAPAAPVLLDFHADYVARLTSRLGFCEGSLDQRARAALRAAA